MVQVGGVNRTSGWGQWNKWVGSLERNKVVKSLTYHLLYEWVGSVSFLAVLYEWVWSVSFLAVF